MTTHLAYRHVQTYTTLWLIDLALAVITVPMVLASGGPDTQLGLAIVLATVLGLPLILGRLVVELDATQLRWHFGYLGWPAWSQPLAEIAITAQELRSANAQVEYLLREGLARRGRRPAASLKSGSSGNGAIVKPRLAISRSMGVLLARIRPSISARPLARAASMMDSISREPRPWPLKSSDTTSETRSWSGRGW
jgi:hypothetical protein